jgi:hypothetical protein
LGTSAFSLIFSIGLPGIWCSCCKLCEPNHKPKDRSLFLYRPENAL